jgi:hypothetical protein
VPPAVVAWAAGLGTPVYAALGISSWWRADDYKLLTKASGALKTSPDININTAVVVDPGRRWVHVDWDVYGDPVVTDVARQNDGTVWCRAVAPAAVPAGPWILAATLQPEAKTIVHYGRRLVVQTALGTAIQDYNIVQGVPVPRPPLPALPALAPLPDPPAVARDLVASVCGPSRGNLALEWLAAAGKLVCVPAVQDQALVPYAGPVVVWMRDAYPADPGHVVVWTGDADPNGPYEFAVAAKDGTAFYRVTVNYVGDDSHGGVVAAWTVDDVEVVTLYTNRRCNKTQAVFDASMSWAVERVLKTVMNWAFDHHPRGEDFAMYHTAAYCLPATYNRWSDHLWSDLRRVWLGAVARASAAVL